MCCLSYNLQILCHSELSFLFPSLFLFSFFPSLLSSFPPLFPAILLIRESYHVAQVTHQLTILLLLLSMDITGLHHHT